MRTITSNLSIFMIIFKEFICIKQIDRQIISRARREFIYIICLFCFFTCLSQPTINDLAPRINEDSLKGSFLTFDHSLPLPRHFLDKTIKELSDFFTWLDPKDIYLFFVDYSTTKKQISIKQIIDKLFKIKSNENKNGQLSIMSFINSPLSTSADSDQNGAFVKFGYGGSAKSLFWKIQQVTNGQWAGKAYYIRSFCGKSLDIFGNITPEGNDVGQWDFHGNLNQQFLIEYFDSKKVHSEEIDSKFAPKQGTKYYIFSAKDPSKFLTVDSNSKLIASSYEGKAQQQFTFTLHDHRYSLLNVFYNKNITVENPNDGKQPIVNSAFNLFNQANCYQIVKNSEGEWAKKGYLIKDFKGTYAFDLTSQAVSHGSKVVVWTVHNGGNQTWLIMSVEEYNKQHQKTVPVVQKVESFNGNMGFAPNNNWPTNPPQSNPWQNNQFPDIPSNPSWPINPPQQNFSQNNQPPNINTGVAPNNPWPTTPTQSNPWQTQTIPASQSQNSSFLPKKQPVSSPHVESPIKSSQSHHPHNHHKHHDYFANKECIIRSATHPNKVLAYHKGWLHSYLVIEDYTGDFNQKFYIFQAARKAPYADKDAYQIICIKTGKWIFMPHPNVGQSMQLRYKEGQCDFFKIKHCPSQYGSEHQHHKYFYIICSVFQGYSFEPHGYANDSKIQVRKFEPSTKQLWKIDTV